MWLNLLGTILNWLGCLTLILIFPILSIGKTWSQELKLSPADYRAKLQKTMLGSLIGLAGLILTRFILQLVLIWQHFTPFSILLVTVVWTVLSLVAIWLQKKKMARAPDKDGEILWWYLIRGDSWKLVHRDAARPLGWWDIGCYSPAMVIHCLSTKDRNGNPVLLRVRYYGLAEARPDFFRRTAFVDYKHLLRYCHDLDVYGYKEDSPPIYSYYLPEAPAGNHFPRWRGVHRIVCMEPDYSYNLLTFVDL